MMRRHVIRLALMLDSARAPKLKQDYLMSEHDSELTDYGMAPI
jgi:hypothetical protein